MKCDLPSNLPPLLKRAAGVHGIRVEHRVFAEAVVGIKQAVAMSQFTPIVQCVLMTGDSGTGKTYVSDTLLEAYSPTTDAGLAYITTRVGAAYVETPSPASIDGIARVILTGLKDPFPSAGSPANKTARIIVLTTEMGTRLIILDEFHNLFSFTDPKQIEKVRNWVRILINELEACLVIAGLPSCRDLITGDKQLGGRFQHRFELKPLRLLENGRLTLQEYLGAFSKDVPEFTGVKSCLTFEDKNHALCAFATTGGNPRAITHLYEFAVLESLRDSTSDGHVTLAHFTAAARKPYFSDFALVTTPAFDLNPDTLISLLNGQI